MMATVDDDEADDDELQHTKHVHYMQRERGVTCGLVASCGEQYFADLVTEQRHLTDSIPMEAAARSTLMEARAVADGAATVDADAATVAAAFVTVFSSFNELIKQTIDRRDTTSDVASTFAQLKEATGIERAFLCGALALPSEALAHLPSRAFAELVLGLQQQRAHEATLRATAPPKLLELIRAGFEYSPALRDVQSRLHADFDVARLRETVSADECWRMFTDHIDKLERLQELLHDALQVQRESEGAAEAAVREALGALASAGGDEDTLAGKAERLSSIPAELLKKEVVRYVTKARASARAAAQRRRTSREAEEAVGSPRRGDALHDEMESLCPAEQRIDLGAIAFKRRIGQGAAGVTYLAEHGGQIVCVKLACGGSGADDWAREVRALGRLRHPNIVTAIGVICAPPSLGLVIEYCPGGDVATFVLDKAQTTPAGFILHVALGIATGMRYLHEHSVLHRDLKGANVLLDAAGDVKIIDFGLSVDAPDDTRRGGWLTAETGTYRFMAPEVVCHERYSKPSDVFSFACVLFELVAREQPFADRPPLQAAVAVGLNHTRPPLPDGVPAALSELWQACWRQGATDRPSFKTIVEELEAMPSVLDTTEHAWLNAPAGHPIYGTTPTTTHSSSAPDPSEGAALRADGRGLAGWLNGLLGLGCAAPRGRGHAA